MIAARLPVRETSIARWLRATARATLDTLFPWSCAACGREGETILCPDCVRRVRWAQGVLCPVCGLPLASGPEHPCSRCLDRPPAFARARAIAWYRARDEGNDPLGAALRAIKYSGRRALAGPLAGLLADRFPFDHGEFDAVVPVPLHLERLRTRGFNQALLLARGPASRFRIRLEARALIRNRATPPQVGLDETERRRNLRGAFVTNASTRLEKLRVLLVDDVATSLATADACARALRAGGAASVDVLTVARTLPR